MKNMFIYEEFVPTAAGRSANEDMYYLNKGMSGEGSAGEGWKWGIFIQPAARCVEHLLFSPQGKAVPY